MKLYCNPVSGPSRKAMSLVRYLGIDAEIKEVNLMIGEQRSPDYLAVNPNGKVPVLVDGDFTLWESNAILIYLANLHPEAGLLPADPKEQANVLRWVFWETNNINPGFTKILIEAVLKALFGDPNPPDPEVLARLDAELHQTCGLLEEQLQSNEYVCGTLSIADFALGAMFDYSEALSFDSGKYPNITAWRTRLHALKGWVKGR